MNTNLLDAPIWTDPATWIVLGVSLLFIVVGILMHRIIMKVVRTDEKTDDQNMDRPPENHR